MAKGPRRLVVAAASGRMDMHGLFEHQQTEITCVWKVRGAKVVLRWKPFFIAACCFALVATIAWQPERSGAAASGNLSAPHAHHGSSCPAQCSIAKWTGRHGGECCKRQAILSGLVDVVTSRNQWSDKDFGKCIGITPRDASLRRHAQANYERDRSCKTEDNRPQAARCSTRCLPRGLGAFICTPTTSRRDRTTRGCSCPEGRRRSRAHQVRNGCPGSRSCPGKCGWSSTSRAEFARTLAHRDDTSSLGDVGQQSSEPGNSGLGEGSYASLVRVSHRRCCAVHSGRAANQCSTCPFTECVADAPACCDSSADGCRFGFGVLKKLRGIGSGRWGLTTCGLQLREDAFNCSAASGVGFRSIGAGVRHVTSAPRHHMGLPESNSKQSRGGRNGAGRRHTISKADRNELAVATANVSTLQPGELRSDGCDGDTTTGRMAMLDTWFNEVGMDLVGIQEGRPPPLCWATSWRPLPHAMRAV